MNEHGFSHMPSPTRSVAIELAEHAEAITAWRNGLPERQRRRLIHPLSCVRRWRAATQSPTDKHDANRATSKLALDMLGVGLFLVWRHCRRM